MKKTAIGILIAVLVVAIGGGLVFAGLSAVRFQFDKLDRTEYVTNTYTFGNIRAIDVEGHTADVELLMAGDGQCKVVCAENDQEKYTVTASDGKLVIRPEDKKTSWSLFSFHFKNPKITIYLPAGNYDLLKAELDAGDLRADGGLSFTAIEVDLDTGDLTMNGVYTERIAAHSDTGDIRLSDMQPQTAELTVHTGEITLTNVVCVGDLRCESSTGDIHLTDVDGANVYLKASTGDITGTIRTAKTFVATTSTGDVSVPGTTAPGRCEAHTSTGDVRLSVSGK